MTRSVSFGAPSVTQVLLQKLDDATTGNKDGIVANERQRAGATAETSFFDTNPLLFKTRAFLLGLQQPGGDERLATFLSRFEKDHGPVTTQAKPAHVSTEDWNAFRAEKAMTLLRVGATTADVTDSYVQARGSVDGNAIAARAIFTQAWTPIGKPSGKTIVVSPGFLETGRDYVDQVQLLRKAGHKVVVMDHQWTGLSSGAKSGIDRGFGIARDVAAVTAAAAKDGNRTIIVGTSMGAGAGALGAVMMNDSGRIALVGPQMPKAIDIVLQAPFFEKTGSLPNHALALVGQVPLLKELPVPAFGLPILSHDSATLRMIAANATVAQVSARAQAFNASTADLATMRHMLDQGQRPLGNVSVIHSNRDTLASYEATRAWVGLLGANARLRTVSSNSHVFENNAAEQGLVLEALATLSR